MSDPDTLVERTQALVALTGDAQLGRLLADVHRIADGMEGIRDLAISGGVTAANGVEWILNQDEDKALLLLRTLRDAAALMNLTTVTMPIAAATCVLRAFERRKGGA